MNCCESDPHVLGGFVKRGPRIKAYRDYKSYNPDKLNYDIVHNVLPRLSVRVDYDSLEDTITEILKQHIPIKKKYIRANDGAFMNKELRKAIMHRSKLRNICNKTKTEENLIAYKKQRNKCVKLLRKRKRDYFRNLDPKDITDNRKF